MSRLVDDSSEVDLQKIVRTNPNVDLDKVHEVRDLLRILRSYGISDREYTLSPPFQRQVYIDIKHRKEDTELKSGIYHRHLPDDCA